MYSFDSRISYSQVDDKENMSINAIINYFQDASTFQSEDLGVGYGYLRPRNLLWVINTWQIDIIKYPRFLDRVKIVTIPYEFRGFLGYRNFYLENEQGEILIKANTLWSLINSQTMKPEKAPDDMVEAYGYGKPIDMEYVKGKLRLPEEVIKHDAITVEKHFIDPNHHMNNGQYINIAKGYIPDDFDIKRLRAEYRNQAFLGDVLYPVSGKNEDGRYTVAINDENGKPYSVIEFS